MALPESCSTMTKHMQAAARVFSKKSLGEIYCPLRKDPLAFLHREYEKMAGQSDALVRRACSVGPGVHLH
eukprot:SAG11_NODE_4404_length_1910_cov_1.432358_1_plen_70_part_00